nr:hypothetical protein CFP56_42527 [Quercus suber]
MLTSAAKSMRDKHLSRLRKTLLMIMAIFLPGVLEWGEKIVANGEGSTRSAIRDWSSDYGQIAKATSKLIGVAIKASDSE